VTLLLDRIFFRSRIEARIAGCGERGCKDAGAIEGVQPMTSPPTTSPPTRARLPTAIAALGAPGFQGSSAILSFTRSHDLPPLTG